MYASVNVVNIGSDNGLPPVRCVAITWTNTDLSTGHLLDKNLSEIRIKIQKKFIHENALENVVCELAVLPLGRSLRPDNAYTRQWMCSALDQEMASHLFGSKPLHEATLIVIWTIRNKREVELNQNIFFQWIWFHCAISKMGVMLRLQ